MYLDIKFSFLERGLYLSHNSKKESYEYKIYARAVIFK